MGNEKPPSGGKRRLVYGMSLKNLQELKRRAEEVYGKDHGMTISQLKEKHPEWFKELDGHPNAFSDKDWQAIETAADLREKALDLLLDNIPTDQMGQA